MVYFLTRTLILLDLMTSFNFNYLHKLFPNTIMLGLHSTYEFGARQKHSVHNRDVLEVFRSRRCGENAEQNIQENLQAVGATSQGPGLVLGSAQDGWVASGPELLCCFIIRQNVGFSSLVLVAICWD